MLTKFILIVIFAHSYGPHANYTAIGEFENLGACQAAAKAVKKAGNDLDLMGHTQPKFVCAAKQ
jgi:hypothetical protein